MRQRLICQPDKRIFAVRHVYYFVPVIPLDIVPPFPLKVPHRLVRAKHSSCPDFALAGTVYAFKFYVHIPEIFLQALVDIPYVVAERIPASVKSQIAVEGSAVGLISCYYFAAVV